LVYRFTVMLDVKLSTTDVSTPARNENKKHFGEEEEPQYLVKRKVTDVCY